MAFRLRVGDIKSITTKPSQWTSGSAEWEIELASKTGASRARLYDPSAKRNSLGVTTVPETTIKWYLEHYLEEPFETTRADVALETLLAYGRELALQISTSGLLPRNGDIELEVLASDYSADSKSVSHSVDKDWRTIQQLHWEVLEDINVWPRGYSFRSVSVFRSLCASIPISSAEDESARRKRFNILLVVSRPKQAADLDYQLISRCLVAIINHVSKTKPDGNVFLKILRPPTWQAFREHLQEYDYDLVHMDMHGGMKHASDGSAEAVLAFCRPALRNPLKMKEDLRTGDEVGSILARSKVKTVVLNACESASFQHSSSKSNLAEVFLRHGIQSVLAMAYKVGDETVEIFMNAFYQSLLIQGASVADAARTSRLALMRNRSRRAKFMQNIQLSDYIVPILYTTSPKLDFVGFGTEKASKGSIFSYLEKALNSMPKISSLKQDNQHAILATQQDLVGRDTDILSLEILLSISRVILVHGQGGCGKSKLLRYLCRWWVASGWIKGWAFIDFADDSKYLFDDFISDIGAQLGIDPEHCSQPEVIGKLQSGRYLLVFDSADAVDSPILSDAVVIASNVPAQLRSFIDVATSDGSFAIVASRQDATDVANIPSEQQKYHLNGLSVLDSVVLLQSLAFKDVEVEKVAPEMFHRRDNIDFLRRAAIILEGNPAAIELIVPAFKLVNYDGEMLLKKLLYGVCEIGDEQKSCRFAMSIQGAMILPSFIDFDKTLIQASHFSVFWTFMPQNLNYFYWFFYLFCSEYYQEAAYKNWISKQFQDIVNNAQMARRLREHWPGIEKKLIQSGMLEHAVVKRKDGGDLPCYHVHPLYTLIGRSLLGEKALKEAKFAYIRSVVLWDRHHGMSIESVFERVEWQGVEQHEDYVHNMRAIAMAWSLDDGDLEEEVERMGISLFDVTYTMSIDSLYVNQRQPKLFIPHIWNHLLRVTMLVTLIRPDCIPTRRDLDAILSHTWALCRLMRDNDTQRLPLVTSALEAVDRYKAASPQNQLTSPQELSWFQLRSAEAEIAEVNSIVTRAKELYERNLATDPSFPKEDSMYNATRRCQLQGLTNWSGLVTRIAARDGTIERGQVQAALRKLNEEFGSEGLQSFITRTWTENPEILSTMKVRDQLIFAVTQEKDAVSKFGEFAKSILDTPFVEIFADVAGPTGQSGNIFALLPQLLNADNPQGAEFRAMFGTMESAFRMISGDLGAAASSLTPNLQREALSSTISTGWENLADLHMQHYGLAVFCEAPDYKKGLTHLEQWWKQHRGVGISRRDLCYGHLKFATCYNALNRVAEAGRSVITCMEIIPTMQVSDCAEGDNVGGFMDWLLIEVHSLDKLKIFLDPRVIFVFPSSIAELTWQERVTLYQTMTKAQQTKKDSDACDASAERLEEALLKMNEMLKRLKTSDGSGVVTDTDRKIDEIIGKMEVRKSKKKINRPQDWWLG